MPMKGARQLQAAKRRRAEYPGDIFPLSPWLILGNLRGGNWHEAIDGPGTCGAPFSVDTCRQLSRGK